MRWLALFEDNMIGFVFVSCVIFTIRKHISWCNFAYWFIKVNELGKGIKKINGIVSRVDGIDLIVVRIDTKSHNFTVFFIESESTHKIYSTVITYLIEVSLES